MEIMWPSSATETEGKSSSRASAADALTTGKTDRHSSRMWDRQGRNRVLVMTQWTTDDIPPLTGLTTVVTGANSGLGFESARALARAGAHVVLACRDQAKAESARDRIGRETPDADVRVDHLDLADLSSVQKFAAEFAAGHTGLDVLVNNAGVM